MNWRALFGKNYARPTKPSFASAEMNIKKLVYAKDILTILAPSHPNWLLFEKLG